MQAILRRAVVACALAALLSTSAPAAYPLSVASSDATVHQARSAPLVLGAGSRPGLAVDAAGTGYIAWIGPEASATSLQFCRLPRGASTCASRHAIAVPAGTTSGSRPFPIVSGTRVVVVQYRTQISGSNPSGVYKFTSTNNGSSFAAGVLIGTVPFWEGVAGPGDTFSGVPVDTEMAFQNVGLASGSTVDKAVLSTDHQNQASVGLVDAATPLSVFTDGDAAQWRRYDGSGNINSATNWTPAANIGIATYPKLAGGPAGLFLLAGNGNFGLNVRKYTGSGFGAPVSIGPGLSPSKHFFQDAGGRLHAVFQRDNADPLRIMHAVSDDGVHWRVGPLVTQRIATDGGIADLRVAAAADHIGFTVWHAGLGAGDVRIAGIGPDAPLGVVSFAASPKSLKVSRVGKFAYHFAVTSSGGGTISMKSTTKVKVGATRRYLTIPGKAYSAALPGRVNVRFDLSATNLRALKRVGHLLFRVTVTLGKRYTTTLKLRAP